MTDIATQCLAEQFDTLEHSQEWGNDGTRWAVSVYMQGMMRM